MGEGNEACGTRDQIQPSYPGPSNDPPVERGVLSTLRMPGQGYRCDWPTCMTVYNLEPLSIVQYGPDKVV